MSVRDRLLELTIAQVEQHGDGFKLTTVAEEAGVTLAMVNHYFGNRDDLVAEAAFTIYYEYIESLRKAFDDAENTPEARLTAWIRGQIGFQAQKRGWSVIFNYPAAVPGVSSALNRKFGPQVKALFELNIARLFTLVRDVADGKVTPQNYTVTDYPREELLSDREIVASASSIAWSTLGASIWAAGEHMPSQSSGEVLVHLDAVTAKHVENLLGSIRRRY